MLTIKLTKEEFAEATSRERLSELSGEPLLEAFIFDEYRLKAFNNKYSSTVVYKVSRKDDVVKVDFKILSEEPIEVEIEVKRGGKPKITYMNKEYSKLVDIYSKKENRPIAWVKEDGMADVLDSLLALEDYIMLKCEVRDRVYKQATSKARNSKPKKNTPAKKETNDLVMLKDLITYVSHSNIKHNIQCECWRVRGHYRHYKSGKVVFIKEFKKGKHRDKTPEDKIYKLEG